MKQPQPIRQYDHVGIRVSDRQQAVAFYEQLGFQEVRRFDKYEANEMETPDGVRINLIFNATRLPHGRNVLLDEPIKLPGVTHPAFVVDDLYALKDWPWIRQALPLPKAFIVSAHAGSRCLFVIPTGTYWSSISYCLNQGLPAHPPATTINAQEAHAMKLYDLELSGTATKSVCMLRWRASISNWSRWISRVAITNNHRLSHSTLGARCRYWPMMALFCATLRRFWCIWLANTAATSGGQTAQHRQGEVMQWLSTAANEIHAGPNAARLIDKFGYPLDKARALEVSAKVLPLIEKHLSEHPWLALGRPTIADCAVFPYVATGWGRVA